MLSPEVWAERYSRQILLPEVGGEGQRRLDGASVGVVGGGLMAEQLLSCLAGAGVGRMGWASWAGNTGPWLAENLQDAHPHLHITRTPLTLEEASLEAWAAPWPWIVDVSQNDQVRQILGDLCRVRGKKFLSAWIEQDMGWMVVGRGFCSTCMTPPSGEGGVGSPTLRNMMEGVLGAMLAGDLLKGVLGLEGEGASFLLRFDGKNSQYARTGVAAMAECPDCGCSGSVRQGSKGEGEGPTVLAESFIDITGETCPMTFVRVKLQLESMLPGAVLRVRLTGGEPLENVPRAVAEDGHGVREVEPFGKVFEFCAVRK